MSQMHTLKRYAGFLALMGLFALSQPATVCAQALDDYVNKQKIAAQKLESEVNEVLKKVRAKEQTDPVAALNLLNNAFSALEYDSALPEEKKTQLMKYVSERIKQVEVRVAAQSKKGGSADNYKSARDKYLKGAAVQQPDAGAFNTASELHRRFGKSVIGAKNYRFDQERGYIRALDGIATSAVPPKSDFEYPAYWVQLKENRKQFVGPRLTKEEAALLKVMNSTLSVDFDNAPFGDVIKYLQKRTGAIIAVNPNAMKEVGTSYDMPISLQGEKLGVRTILRTVLAQVNLAYILKDGVVHVVTPDEARNTMTVQAFPVAGLIPPAPPGPFFMQANFQQFRANQIMQMIVTTVEPTTWAINGGRGTIWFDPITQSIIVRQSAELHLPVQRSLGIGGGR